jgi:hypothetical protein
MKLPRPERPGHQEGHAAVLSICNSQRSLEGMRWERQGVRVECGRRILFALISAIRSILLSGDLLGAARFPRNLIMGVRWCTAARSIMDALIAVSASGQVPCVNYCQTAAARGWLRELLCDHRNRYEDLSQFQRARFFAGRIRCVVDAENR